MISEMIKVEIVVREGCRYSERVLQELHQLQIDFPEINFEIVNMSDCENNHNHGGGITPSIWVNGKLWFLGTFCSEVFNNKLKELVYLN